MHRRSLTLGATLALAVGALAAAPALAQSTAPSGAPMMAMDPESHPAHVHVGSCPAPGDVVAPLSNVSEQFLVDGTASMGSTAMGQAATALAIDASVTNIKLALADILSSPHAIVVHHTDQDMATYILCGDVGGYLLGTSDLPVALGALNDSGFSGVAWLSDNGDGTTKVVVFAIPPAVAH